MAKSLLPWWEVFLLAFMAGAYVAVAGAFAVMFAGGLTCSGQPGDDQCIGLHNST